MAAVRVSRWVAVGVAAVFVALGIGCTRNLSLQTDPEKLWLQSTDWALTNRATRETYFGRGREENFLVTTTPPGNDVMDGPAVLMEMLELVGTINDIKVTRNNRTYTTLDLCVKLEIPGQAPQCLVMSVLAWFEYNPNRIMHATRAQLYDVLNSPPPPSAFFPRNMVVSGRTLTGPSTSNLTRTEAFKLWMYMDDSDEARKAHGPVLRDLLLDWEQQFLDILERHASSTAHVSVFRQADRSMSDVILDDIETDVPWIIGSVVAFAVLAFFSDLPSYAPTEIAKCLGAVVFIFMSQFATIGLLSGYCGVVFSLFSVLTTVFVFSTGIFHAKSLVHGRSTSLHELGLMLAASTIAFGVLAILPDRLPATLAVCVTAMVGFLFMMAAVVALEPFFAEPDKATRLQTMMHCVFARYHRLVRTTLVLVALACIGGAAGICGTYSGGDANEWDVLSKGSYLRTFKEQNNHFFGLLGAPVDIILPAGLPYPDANKVAPYAALGQSGPLPGVDPHTFANWLDVFYGYCKQNAAKLNGTVDVQGHPIPQDFYMPFFLDFVVTGAAGQLMSDFYPRGGLPEIQVSKMSGYTVSLVDRKTQIHAVEGLHDALQSLDEGLIAYSPPFPAFRQFTTVDNWSKKFMVTSCVACAVIIMAILVFRKEILSATAVGSLSVPLALLCTLGLYVAANNFPLDSRFIVTLALLPFVTMHAVSLANHSSTLSALVALLVGLGIIWAAARSPIVSEFAQATFVGVCFVVHYVLLMRAFDDHDKRNKTDDDTQEADGDYAKLESMN